MEKRCFSAKKYAGSGIGIGGKHTPNMPDMTDRKEKPQNLVVIFGRFRPGHPVDVNSNVYPAYFAAYSAYCPYPVLPDPGFLTGNYRKTAAGRIDLSAAVSV